MKKNEVRKIRRTKFDETVNAIVAEVKALPLSCRMSAEDSHLRDVWEEFCDQIQTEESVLFEAYEDTIRMMVERTVSAMMPSEVMLLWLSTDEYFDYDPEREVHDGLFPHAEEMAEAIVGEIYQGVCSRAADEDLPQAPWEMEEVDDEYSERDDACGSVAGRHLSLFEEDEMGGMDGPPRRLLRRVRHAGFEAAVHIATEAHRGQVDKAGAPYVLHPFAVASMVGDEVLSVVAVLHDVVEDTPVTLSDLLHRGFPEVVVAAVDALTLRRGEAYEDFIVRAKANPIARTVKIADVRHNMDLSRIPNPTERDHERMERYRKALRVLRDQPDSENAADDREKTPARSHVREVTMASGENERVSWSVTVKTSPGEPLVLSGYDTGSYVQEWHGSDDMEHWLTVPAENKDDVLLRLLEGGFGSTSAFREWLDKGEIPYKFDIW